MSAREDTGSGRGTSTTIEERATAGLRAPEYERIGGNMKPDTVFRSRDLPVAAHRFEAWREHLAKTICPMDTSSEHSGDFHGELRCLRLGSVSVLPTTVQPVTGLRTPKLVRQSDPEFYDLALLIRGTMTISHAGREEEHGARQMYVVDTSHPWKTVAGTVTSIGLGIPKNLVPLPSDRVDRLLARALPSQEGIGALLAQFLTQLAGESTYYGPADATRLGTVALDLFTATLAHHLEAEDAVPPETHHQALALRIKAFIQQHLSDPDLRPATIAAAHHISLSHLHGLFRNEETTVAAWVRRRRLERAHRELADPAWRTTPIHAIAARCGFTRAADFTRAFRTAYGVPPRDYRNAVRSPGD
ncbi:helix-turn-helix domain-containing protein [Streptomyces sp. NPDC051776]|uniref:AraC-like ligand-binding domain-containing protein n=1 Tax=Streptomyces sp. NPDC051776 TaxID=3155414 RepID=UPI003434DADC